MSVSTTTVRKTILYKFNSSHNPDLNSLPEKVLAFGTGVLLRGLPNYFIDHANKQGVFNGRIVVVKSTTQGGVDAYAEQHNLYTHIIRGVKEDKLISQTIINASISRVLSANDEWNEILKCAQNPAMQIIISNTTEAGIVLVNNDAIDANPPISFPAKLLAFLFARYLYFNGSSESGMVIIPTELISDNGKILKAIVQALAIQHQLDESFIDWLIHKNDFCNSLVDRIVPGSLSLVDKAAMELELGYEDNLMISSELYGFWAIETVSNNTREILSFGKANNGITIANDIQKYRELKLHLLNSPHTFSCSLAILAGFKTVKEAMNHEKFYHFISNLLASEILSTIISDSITIDEAMNFSANVLDRFKNPFIEHKWQSIATQCSLKMKTRNIPLLLKHYAQTNQVPPYMALGFAAFLLYMKSTKNTAGEYMGKHEQISYIIQDDQAALFHKSWEEWSTENFVPTILQNTHLWGTDLTVLNGFNDAVVSNIFLIQTHGILAALDKCAGLKN